MKKAFISYRRQDTEGYAHSLYDRLKGHFDDKQIFMDVDDIKPGEDFVKILQDNLRDCVVLIVLIGRQWVDIKNSAGLRRLENPNDFVRIEVATALERGIPVIPVLVNGASMPTKDELPDNLKDLSQRQAVVITGVSYDYAIEKLVSSIERYFGIKRKSSTQQTIPWYKKPVFKGIWASFFLLLALGIYLEDEELPDPPTMAPQSKTGNVSNTQLAKVMDPPSNIRIVPNGQVICQATSSSVITVMRIPEIAANGGKWYYTNFCGANSRGYIHESQIRLRK